MGFRENLQHLRAVNAMTQEQLALLLGVSRQSVTKWEAERSYPEMDKLMKMCGIFDCTLDDLVMGDSPPSPASHATVARSEALRAAAAGPPQDVCGYDEHMRTFARKVAGGVLVVLLGMALTVALGGVFELGGIAGLERIEGVVVVPLFVGVVLGVWLFVTAGMGHAAFMAAHPFVQDFYTVEQREAAQRRFRVALVGGLAAIFAGIVAMALTDTLSEFWQTEAAALMLALVGVGASSIAWGGIMLSRTNVAAYNDAREEALATGDIHEGIMRMDAAELKRDYTDAQIREMLCIDDPTVEEIERARRRLERKHRTARLRSGLCGMTMILATVAGLLLLFIPGPWHAYFWLAWVVGGLLCAVISIAVKTFSRG